ncbi:hypothetical protein PR202_gb07136 [Eleusine coracana subsp. coracana]|uniref:Uncharacterized protein n=1 Tax=Eleusine coracana subsp. coracana TaxID=191504 RepID=A0AAV5EB98_ELECO|nr:hypothetical protein PR202_gb07136 [Eleusine coracana subsp. coracana]
MIIPEALNCLITENAVKCAKLVLEGTAPELNGHRANPNWMNQYGLFPLHQAAEIFAVDMIKLLISKGASTNVRTAGDRVVNGLLPLHVAVENTCLHKYLEDNQLPNREPSSYSKADVYKLIHLLCLPEMKIFLDTIRELAKHTDDIIDEVWNYIKGGKLVQAGVLLIAAQEHIRLGPSCKQNGNINPDGFATIVSRIANHFYTFDLETGSNEKELEQPHANINCPYQCKEYKEVLDNPNCMNRYGQFPLHQAAKTLSADMVKLLICKGASANVRMAGEVEGLLPLHVAVENTCLHKYLEDHLLPNREHPSYSKADVYKLIHILCLPEMKIFLDTTRELAKHTNDLVDEVWHYIKGGKLVHAGVVLLAAQEQIGLGSSSKKNGNSKPDGFATIVNRIVDHFYTFDLEMDQHEKELKQPHANIKYLSSALLLVNAISQAGKTLQEHIGMHSEVPHVDALERVSSILKDSGFYPAEEGFDIGNLAYGCYQERYKDVSSVCCRGKGTCEVGVPFAFLSPMSYAVYYVEMNKVLYKKWENGYKKALFFPYWRSVLSSNSPVKLFPSHATGEAFSRNVEQLHGSKSMEKISATTSNDNFPSFKRIQQHVNQPRRALSTAATLLKVLKNA